MCEHRSQFGEELKQKNYTFPQIGCDKSCPKTSNIYDTLNLPHRFECPYLFKGYGVQNAKQSPFYRTANSEYGWYPPNPHTVPFRYFPRSQDFSTSLAKSGMYRNYSLNTVMDRKYY